MPLGCWGSETYYLLHSILLLNFFPCSLVAFTILKQAWRNKPICLLPWFDNQIIPLGSGMETYLCWCQQTITGSYSKHSFPKCFLTIFKNITFLTGTTGKINWSSIFENSKYIPFTCTPKNTFAQWSSPLLHSYKMWKRSYKSHISNTTKQLPRSFLKEQDLLFTVNIIKPIKHLEGLSLFIWLPCHCKSICTTFLP